MPINHGDAIFLCRKLRKQSTLTEIKVWHYLRNRKFRNFKFLRQHPIYIDESKRNLEFFIVDFYCHELKFVLELDGKIHDFQIGKDYQRDEIIRQLGLQILHIKNENVTNKDSFYLLLELKMSALGLL
ncbi:MAG TPA: endonuclease domain-containing protein [Saprospiraceae bacterium]|nr:endonuclease domain-containing protein [Saprospiraceae bacterium]